MRQAAGQAHPGTGQRAATQWLAFLGVLAIGAALACEATAFDPVKDRSTCTYYQELRDAGFGRVTVPDEADRLAELRRASDFASPEMRQRVRALLSAHSRLSFGDSQPFTEALEAMDDACSQVVSAD